MHGAGRAVHRAGHQAAVGGVQVAYAAFKSVGITDKWLDALLALGDIKED